MTRCTLRSVSALVHNVHWYQSLRQYYKITVSFFSLYLKKFKNSATVQAVLLFITGLFSAVSGPKSTKRLFKWGRNFTRSCVGAICDAHLDDNDTSALIFPTVGLHLSSSVVLVVNNYHVLCKVQYLENFRLIHLRAGAQIEPFFYFCHPCLRHFCSSLLFCCPRVILSSAETFITLEYLQYWIDRLRHLHYSECVQNTYVAWRFL